MSMPMVAITTKPKTYLYVFAIMVPSPTSVRPTIAHAAMILLRQTPFPADAPQACRARRDVVLVPIFSAAII
eukprot:scaffold434113_cov51-Attheya_sp.AAC.4